MFQKSLSLKVLDDATVGMGVFDAETGLLTWNNKSLKKMTWFGKAKGGRKAKKIHYLDFFPESDHLTILELQRIAMANGHAFDSEREVLKGQNKTLVANIKFIRIEDEISGEKNRFVLELIDLSIEKLYDQLKTKEEQLRRLQGKVKSILDHADSGFLLVDSHGKIQEGVSSRCSRLLGSDVLEGEALQELLGLEGPTKGQFEFALEQCFEDFLPQEVSLAQIPELVDLDDKKIHLATAMVRTINDEPAFVMFTLEDKTALMEAEQENRVKESLIYILQHKATFERLVMEFRKQLDQNGIAKLVDDPERARSFLHAMKGNFSLFGIDAMVDEIHMRESKVDITSIDFFRLREVLSAFIMNNQEILQLKVSGEREKFEVKKERIVELHTLMNSSDSASQLRKRVKVWSSQLDVASARELFQPFKYLIRKLAKKSQKEVEFKLHGGEIEILPSDFKGIFEIVPLLISNAIDHGVERLEERTAKDATALIEFTVEDLDSSTWMFSVRDDGRGINATKLREKAIQEGLLSAAQAEDFSDSEAVYLIFNPHFSMSDNVTVTSGRGYGMVAVMEAIKKIGGHLDVHTKPGKGTRFTFYIPKKNRLTLFDDEDEEYHRSRVTYILA